MFKHKMKFLLVPMLSAMTLHASDPFFNNDPFGDDIFKEMYEMQQQMDKVFERMNQRIQQRSTQMSQPGTQFYLPAIGNTSSSTMFVDKGGYYLYDTGVEASKDNEINLSVQNGMLIFKAKVTKTVNEQNTHQSYTSMMQRSQTLPTDADTSTVKMEEQGGKIVVTVQKSKSAPAIVQPMTQPKVQEQKAAPTIVQPTQATPAEQKVVPAPIDKPTLMPSAVPATDTNKTIQKVPYTSTQG